MSQSEPLAAYSRMQKILHWGTVALVAAQYLVFDGIGRAFGQSMRLGEPQYLPGVGGHIVAGVLVLTLTLWRLTLRVRVGAPQPPKDEPQVLRMIAAGTHHLFYVLLLLLPVSGLVAWFLHVGPAGGAHSVMKTLLLAVIALHVLGALVHQFWWKSGVLRRMV